MSRFAEWFPLAKQVGQDVATIQMHLVFTPDGFDAPGFPLFLDVGITCHGHEC